MLSCLWGNRYHTYVSFIATWAKMSSSYTGVYAIDPLQDDRWPELIARHPNASVFHARGWLRALQATYGYGLIAFTTSAPNERLTNALLFCVIHSWLTGSRFVSLPFSDHCEPLIECAEQFGELCAHVEVLGVSEGRKHVEIRSANPCLEFDKEFGRAIPIPSIGWIFARVSMRCGKDFIRIALTERSVGRNTNRSPMKRVVVRCCSSNYTDCSS